MPSDTIPVGPFLEWFDRRIQFSEEQTSNSVLEQIGWGDDAGERRLQRYRNESQNGDRVTIERALDVAGVDLAEVYPELVDDVELIRRHCATCCEEVTTDSTLICPWCESRTVNSIVCPSCGGRKSGPADMCVGCVPRDERGYVSSEREITLVCPSCNGPKAHGSRTCWSCYVEAGSHTGMRKRKGKALKCISEHTLLRARVLYEEGLSLYQISAAIYADTTYSNERSCAKGLWQLFTNRGWKMRDQREATAEANRQRAHRPRCMHVFNTSMKKGRRCEKRSIGDDGYCWHHKPERIAEGVARLREIDNRVAA